MPAVLAAILEGKAVPSGTSYDYTYYLGDNLGNTRRVVDPLAEVSRRWSPYNQVENNPIRLIDPDGTSAGNPMAQTQDDDPGKENENSKKKSSLDYDLQYAANKAGFDAGKSNQLMSAPWGGEQQSGGDPKAGKKSPQTSVKKKNAKVETNTPDKQKVDPMGAPVLWFGVAGLIMENSKFANVVSGGSKLGKVFSWLSIGNDTRKLVNNDMSTSEWAYNTAFNLIGTKATPVGLAYGAGTYIYPGGVRGALADWHHIIYPGW